MTDTARLIAEAQRATAEVKSDYEQVSLVYAKDLIARLAAALAGGGGGNGSSEAPIQNGDEVWCRGRVFLTHVHAAKPHYAVQIDDGDRGESIIDVGVKDVRRSPEPSPQPPHTERDGGDWQAVLADHWLHQIECDHEAKTDRAICACGLFQSAPQPNVGEAVKRWVEHVADIAHPTPPGPVAGWRNIAEPLGCPTPGACMCPKPVQTRENLARSICRGMWPDHAEMYERNGDVRWADCLRAAEALSALPPEPPVESGED